MSEERALKFLKELGHLRWTVLIIVLMMAVMAYATYVESTEDHKAALAKGFHSLPMDILIAALAVNISACTVSRAPFRPHQYPWLITHAGILLTMAGAIISHRTAREGQIVLRVGQPQDVVHLFSDNQAHLVEPLGLRLELDSFRVAFYPGTGKASDYISFVRVLDYRTGVWDTTVIRVNHPLVRYGWNISQSSFFPGDNAATVLGANKDPGTPVSYAGFLTVFLGMVGIFFLKPYLKRRYPPPVKAVVRAGPAFTEPESSQPPMKVEI